jgi:hypothetical protein
MMFLKALIFKQEAGADHSVGEQKRRKQIMADHRLPGIKEQLEHRWKTWKAQDSLKVRGQGQPVLRLLRRFHFTTQSTAF